MHQVRSFKFGLYDRKKRQFEEEDSIFGEHRYKSSSAWCDVYKKQYLAICRLRDKPTEHVLCDVYNRVPVNTAVCADLGDKTGMPILYYRADVRKFSHDVNHPSNPDNIYNHLDNDELVGLGLPWEATLTTIPPLSSDPSTWFYKRITNTAVTSTLVPFKKSEYILISAGFDGIFGTNDDVYNFRR